MHRLPATAAPFTTATRTRIRAMLAGLVLLAASIAVPAAPAAAAGSGGISGTVLMPDGTPATGVTVTLLRPVSGSQDWSAVTTSNVSAGGAYSFSGLDAGSYALLFKPADYGYARMYYAVGHAAFTIDDAAILAVGDSIFSVPDVSLVRSGRISGTIVDSDGNPLAGVPIRATFVDRFPAGDLTTTSGGNGKYVVYGFGTGEVVLKAIGTQIGMADQYYPSGTFASEALPIAVTAGTAASNGVTTTGIDLTLRPAARVRGTVLSDSGPVPVSVRAYMKDSATDLQPWTEVVAAVRTDADGKYRLDTLPAGKVRIRFVPSSAVYSVEYFDDAAWIGTAKTLKAESGEKIKHVDAVLAPWTGQTVSSGTPIIEGTRRVGDPLTVVSLDAWTPGTEFEFVWIVDGVRQRPSKKGTFTPAAEHLGADIDVEVTGHHIGYNSATSASIGTMRVTEGVLETTRPSIDGKAKVGKTLKAKPGQWTDGTDFAYEWRIGSTPIPGETHKKLTLTKSLKGEKVKVRVTGSLPGYTDASETSKSVGPISK